MREYFPVIKKSALFQGISEDDLDGMLICLGARTASYSKNQPIFWEGEPANLIGVVLTGKVQIAKDDFFGNRNIISMMEPSQLFGEAFACAGIEKLPVTATAVTDSEILLLDCRRVITTCGNSCEFHNRIIANLLRIVAAKIIMLNQKIELTSKRTTKEKLMAYLLMQAKQNKSRIFAIPYDRQELADYLGVERSAMSTELSKLRREGRIDYHKNQFKILE